MKQCRTCKRTYDDETYEVCLHDGSLLSALVDANATLVLNGSDEIEVTLDLNATKSERKRASVDDNKPKKRTPRKFINDQIIAISIDEQYPHCITADDLYTCTRGLWRLDHERAGRAKYALACVDGKIKEVYEIEQWLPATKVFIDFWVARLNRQGRAISAEELCDRFEFTGHVASEPVRKKYVGRKLPKRHSGNPIMYFNC